MLKSKTYIAIPPGETIKELLQDRGVKQKEFAARMGMTEKHISRLVNGEVALTPETANRLECVLGLPASFWNNLEARYREKILKANAENAMEQDKIIASKYPYKEMVKNKWVADTSNLSEKVLILRKFFEVADLEYLNNNLINNIACRKLGDSEKADYALIAWSQQARLTARDIDTKPINIFKLKSLIPKIRVMTILKPEEFCPKLVEMLSECGIALVFLPHIGGSFLHGASFKDGRKIVIGLTIRGKYADRFWFSLFHELAHVIFGHIDKIAGTTEEDEALADEFARDTLIAKMDYDNFVEKEDFSKTRILSFANLVGVSPCIVIGRLQKDKHIGYNLYNNLKERYEFA